MYANASNVVSSTDVVPRGEDNGANRQYRNRCEDEEVECGAEAEENMMLMQMMRGKRVLKRLTEDSEDASKVGDFMMMMPNLTHVVVI